MIKHSIDAHTADGESFTITVELGAPYPSDDETETWLCQLRLALPNYTFDDGIVGGDQLQALCLAIDTLRRALEAFLEEGGAFTSFALESYGLGNLTEMN